MPAQINVADIGAKLSMDTKQFTNNFRRAIKSAKSTSTQFSKSFTTGVKDASESAKRNVKGFSEQASKDFKDVTRIIQGILISQGFYRLISVIKDTASELFELTKAFEEAQVSFSLLFKDVDKANRFLEVLENFAAVTPFAMDSARQAAQRLLAMGFEAKNIMPVLRGIVDAASLLGGDSETIDQITRALGQMKTAGTVAAKQVNQLAMAGIPVKEILSEELNMTLEQLQRIGDYKIPSDLGVAAILTGMEKRFGGASELISQTFSGLASTVKDNLLLVLKDATDTGFRNVKRNLKELANTLDAVRSSMRSGGIGQVLEDFVSPKMQKHIRIMAANLALLGLEFAKLRAYLAPFAKELGAVLLITFNATITAIRSLLTVLNQLFGPLSTSTVMVKILGRAVAGLIVFNTATTLIHLFTKRLAALMIVKQVTAALWGLRAALTAIKISLASNPWTAILTAIAGLFVYVAAKTGILTAMFKGLQDVMSELFGVGISDTFKKDTVDTTLITNEFNQALDGSAEGLDQLGDSATAAGNKAKKALAAFDEVFTLSDSAGAGSAFDDFEVVVPDVSAELIDEIMRQMEDQDFAVPIDLSPEWTLTEIWTGLKQNLNDMWEFMGQGILVNGEYKLSWDSITESMEELSARTGVSLAQGEVAVAGYGASITAMVTQALIDLGKLGSYYTTGLVVATEKSSNKSISLIEAMGLTIGLIVAGMILEHQRVADEINASYERVKISLSKHMKGMRESMKLLKDRLGEYWEAISAKVADKSEDIRADATDAFTRAKEGITTQMLAAQQQVSDSADVIAARWATLKETIATKTEQIRSDIGAKFTEMSTAVGLTTATMVANALTKFQEFRTGTATTFAGLSTDVGLSLAGMVANALTWFRELQVGAEADSVGIVSSFQTMLDDLNAAAELDLATLVATVATQFAEVKDNILTAMMESYNGVKRWIDKIIEKFNDAIDKLKFWQKKQKEAEEDKAAAKKAEEEEKKKEEEDSKPKYTVPTSPFSNSIFFPIVKPQEAHKAGGVFSEEHVASFAEDGKPEAVIPTANEADTRKVVGAMLNAGLRDAMQSAVQTIAGNSSGSKQNLLVGTLIASDRGLRELDKRMNIIKLDEARRTGGGTAYGTS